MDICFIGNVFPGEREDLLRLLTRAFKNTFVGQAFFEDMARTYSAARIVFNRSVRNKVRGPMRFTQDFLRDFEQFDFFGEPFAFVRYGDGERAICTGQPVVARDGWAYPGGARASPPTSSVSRWTWTPWWSGCFLVDTSAAVR